MDQHREQKEKPLNSFLSPSTPLPTSNIEYSTLATEGEKNPCGDNWDVPVLFFICVMYSNEMVILFVVFLVIFRSSSGFGFLVGIDIVKEWQ